MLDEGHLGAVFKMSLALKHPDHSDEDLEAIRSIYRDHDPEINLFEDSRWALEHYGAQTTLGLITDGNAATQSSKIRALEIGHHFDEMVLTGSLGKPREYHKPHPLSYELIEQKIGTDGDHYVYVGDNPAKDFVVPNARGWTSIQILREQTIHDQSAVVDGGEPQHRIHSLRELPEILRF